MTNQGIILGLMIAHHGLIEMYLSLAKDALKMTVNDALSAFDKFKWQLEKHFFVEEKIIFAAYQSRDEKILYLIEKINAEHKTIKQIINLMRDKIAAGQNTDLAPFEDLLNSHRSLEEKELYPLLDATFSTPQKEDIVLKINDIVLEKTIRSSS
jgi:hemerythrin-like domain-containing protein